MQIIKETVVEGWKVTVYSWNNKYLLKFENGQNELTYKVSQLDITSEHDVELFLSDPHIKEQIRHTFEKMDETLSIFYSKI